MTAPARWALPVAIAGAVALAFAAGWTTLVDLELVSPGPPPESAADSEAGMRAYWVWYAGVVPARQLASFVLLVGLAALSVTAAQVAAVRRTGAAAIAAGVVVAGALFWGIAACVRLGTDQAIALLATHDNPIEPTNSIAFTSSWLASSFELVGSVLAGAGVVALAGSGIVQRPLAAATGLGLVLLGVSGYVPVGDLYPWVLLAVGAFLLPLWLVAAGKQGKLPVEMSINSIHA